MTVSVGPKRFLGASTLLGASQVLGQGNTNTAKDLEWELLFSTDDASVSIPSWTYIQSDMRGFSTSRGRGSELDDVDAGTATFTLNNRARAYDPGNASGPYSPNLRPMNRVWLRMRFNGVTHDVFKGWVERYEQQYPVSGVDAVTVVHAVDEFKVLALRNLPTTDPPRESYTDVIQFDQPVAYWRMDDNFPVTLRATPVIGPEAVSTFSVAPTGLTDGAIAGANPQPYEASWTSAGQQYTAAPDPGTGPDVSGVAEFAVEAWVMTDALPPSDDPIIGNLPNGGAVLQYQLSLTSTGAIKAHTQIDGGAVVDATGGTLPLNTWTHVVATIIGGNLQVYVNAAQVASTAFAGVLKIGTSAALFSMGGSPTAGGHYGLDEVAIYGQGLSQARITAHYDAGVNTGFERSQLAGQRMSLILDSISSQAPRNLRAGARPLAGQYPPGRATLEALRDSENAEAVDAFLFIANDGTITFLDGAHRSSSPWDTVQATFGDAGGSELDYMDVHLDYSDSFIANQWDVTRDEGTTQSTEDSTSIGRYLRRPQSLTGLKLRDDSDALDVATDMLAKYKDPLTRVLSITPKTMDVNVADAVFALEVGDRIRVLLTPPGGGARFDQTLFVQSIQVDATPQDIFPHVTLGVSPV